MTFIVFNRPDSTEAVFNAIRRAKPDKFFVIADGPRAGNVEDIERCALVRNLVEVIDWDCQVYRNYAQENLGVDERVSTGLSWVFEHVSNSIIFEDDCRPHPSFFSFCSALLDHYRDDDRVMAVAGDGPLCNAKHGKYSYYFSKYFHCWGWATWARAWRHFDRTMSGWPEFRDSGGLECWCPNPKERDYWTRLLDVTHRNPRIRQWDFAFHFACWSQSGLTVLPNVNLVSNIGFGGAATHTIDAYDRQGNRPTEDVCEISHPPFVVRNEQADRNEWEQRYDTSLAARVKRKLPNLLGHRLVP